MITSLFRQKLMHWVFFIVLLLGFFLRLYHYLMGRSLWDDESHLALNIMSRNLTGLAKPLDYIQVAPVLFLWLEKIIAQVFGYGEMALRFIPFISSVLTLPLIYYITKQLTGNKIIAILAFFLYSINLSLIYFSSELKQYSVEVSIYLLLVHIAISDNRFISRNRTILLASIGGVSIFLSSTAIIVLFCIGCNSLTKWYEQKKMNKAELKVFILWALFFLIDFYLFLFHHPSANQQKINYSSSFFPTNILSYEFIDFLKKTIDELFFSQILFISKNWGFAFILLFVLFIAIRHLVLRNQKQLFILVCLPILIHLCISALKLYPFVYRLILYLAPCFIILISLGIVLVAQYLKKKVHALAAVAVILYCAFFLSKDSIRLYPLWFREIKPSLQYVNDSLPATTHVYITDPTNVYTYYNKRGFVKNNIYKEVPWEIDLPAYYDMVYNENSNYVLFYSTLYQWGYGNVLKDLKEKGLIVKTFEYKGYAVSEIKPLQHDSALVSRLDYTYFDPALTFGDDKAVAVWTDEIVSKPVNVKAGKYSICILARGTPVNGVFPDNKVYLNDQVIGEFVSHQKYDTVNLSYETKKDVQAFFKIKILNDSLTKKEDRNTFIKSIKIYSKNPAN